MNVKIGTKIKELRKRDGVTQERLAEIIGVTSQAVSKWESEVGYPDIEYIIPIADFFDVTLDYLFDRVTGEKLRKIEEYRDIVKKIQNIQDASHHLLNLINEILGMPKANGSEGKKPENNIYLANMNEMKAPINVIREMASIGADAADVDKKDRAIQKIQDASNHLLGVVNDILDISEIRANKFKLSVSDFNFEKMMQRITGIVNVRAVEKRQKLTCEIDPAIPENLSGDEGRLAQVMLNLLSNAVKFTPEEGAIHINVKLSSKNNDTCILYVSVRDTGTGLSPERRDNLFNDSIRPEPGAAECGLGLGLAITKGIVELMGGIISVKSELGKGSVFSFTVCLGCSYTVK